MPGPPPKPSHIRLVEGNAARRPLNKKEPKPKRGIPKCPAYLSEQAKALWKRLGPELDTMGVLTIPDGTALELICDAYAEWYTAREAILAAGTTYTTTTETGGTMYRARPEVAMAADAYRRVMAGLAQFGLTPASRTKVNAEGPEEKQDPMDAFLGKKRGRA